MSLSAEEKYALITRNLQEVLGEAEIRSILAERDLVMYWGTAPTGKPHIGYFVPLTKIADFLRAGCRVKVLFADLHAYLDNQKAPWDLLKHRTRYYAELIKATLTSLGVATDQLEFVQGTDYQLSQKYTLDVYRLSALVSQHDFKKAGAEVVKQTDHPPLSGLLYPGLQALDEEHLGVDCQFGGVDQRKIFTFAMENLPALGYRKRSHLMNAMIPGLMGTKMSSSDPDSKIDLLEPAKDVERKIKRAFCEEGLVKDNGLLAFLKSVVFPMRSLKSSSSSASTSAAGGSAGGATGGAQTGVSFVRKAEFGGDVTYATYASLEADYAARKLHPGDLKKGVTAAINELLQPIREHWAADPELAALTALAYPDATAAAKAAQGSDAAGKAPKVKSKGGNASSGAGAGAAAGGGGNAGGNKGGNIEKPKDISRIELRVGRVESVSLHPEADSLYVERISYGDTLPARTVVSGLVRHIDRADFEGRLVVTIANLKPSKLRGVVSEAMVLCASVKPSADAASSADGGAASGEERVELVAVPEGAQPGSLIGVPGYPCNQHDPKNTKVWGEVQPLLRAGEDGVCTYNGAPLVVVPQGHEALEVAGGGGVLRAPTLRNAALS